MANMHLVEESITTMVVRKTIINLMRGLILVEQGQPKVCMRLVLILPILHHSNEPLADHDPL
jgi:hypothetical protein